jgi:hypothetical protein
MSLNDYEPPPRAPSPDDEPACWDTLLERCEFQELGPKIQELLRSDIVERDANGLKKYGVRLRPHDGRNTLHDIYQELLDTLVYSVKYHSEMMVAYPSGSMETQNGYHLFKRSLDLVVDVRRLIYKVEGK